jgi:hypothetical protein
MPPIRLRWTAIALCRAISARYAHAHMSNFNHETVMRACDT